MALLLERSSEPSVDSQLSRLEANVEHLQVDAADIKLDQRALGAKIDGNFNALNGKIDANFNCLNGKFDANGKELNGKIDANFNYLSGKVDSNFKWMLGGFVALLGAMGTGYLALSNHIDGFSSRMDSIVDRLGTLSGQQAETTRKLDDILERLGGAVSPRPPNVVAPK